MISRFSADFNAFSGVGAVLESPLITDNLKQPMVCTKHPVGAKTAYGCAQKARGANITAKSLTKHPVGARQPSAVAGRL